MVKKGPPENLTGAPCSCAGRVSVLRPPAPVLSLYARLSFVAAGCDMKSSFGCALVRWITIRSPYNAICMRPGALDHHTVSLENHLDPRLYARLRIRLTIRPP